MASLAHDASSIPDLLRRRARATPSAVALEAPRPGGGWITSSWQEVEARARAIAAGLLGLGIGAGDRCAIVATTSVEWILADLGILSAGGATTTVYPTGTEEECAYILGDAGVRVAFVEDEAQLAKVAARRLQLRTVDKVAVLAPGAVFEPRDGWAISLADLERGGREWELAHPDAVDRVVSAIGRDRLATLIYTSGTTGRPKGVELTHDGWLYEAEAIEGLGLVGPTDHQLLWLPLAHAFGKVLEVAQIAIGLRTSVDGRVAELSENLAEVEPTFMAAPPRVFEKVHHRVLATVAAKGHTAQRLFGWALGVGREVGASRARGEAASLGLRMRHWLADRLVLRKVRARFGTRLRFLVSGSAPLPPEIAEFFLALGVLVLEGYGLTESSAATCVNRLDRWRLGTVGLPLPGTEVRIAADGEVLVRGPGVMRGYHGMPEESEAALADGWLRTGDIGEVDAEGFVRVTDRKKDLIKTAYGKYVAPQKVEKMLESSSPYVSNVVVHGDGRPYCVALITLDADAVAVWARAHGRDASHPERLARDAELVREIEASVAALNERLAPHERIRKHAILEHDFAVDTGEVTPSLKVKRRAVESMHRIVLDSLYDEPTVPGRMVAAEAQ